MPSHARHLMGCLCAVVLMLSSTSFAKEQSYTTNVSEFEDIEYRDETLKINNFTIKEEHGFMTPDGWSEIDIQMSGKNSSETNAAKFQLQIAGFDESGKLLWATIAQPGMGIIRETKVEGVNGSALVKEGTLAKTKRVEIILRGSW